MKNFSLPLLAFLALALLTLAPRPAQAQWVLDHYACAGTYSINGVSTPWPTSTQSVSFYYGGSATLQCVGTVQAFFKWTGAAPAPSTLNALITSSAAAYGTGPNPDDGFHDSIVVAYSRTSAGSHLVQVANPTNSTLVAVPPTGQAAYSLSAITTGGISVSFQASVVNAVLQGYSTHVSPALTQVEQIPLTTWDPANPRYFSGTGCEARGTAVPLTGYLSHVQLCINDQVVQEYWDSAAAGKPSPLPTDGSVVTGTNLPNSSQPSPTLKALFDSTHFADASPITIKMKVTDSNSGYYEVTVAGPVKNRVYAVANQEFPNRWPFRSSSNAFAQITDVASQATGDNYFAVSTHSDSKDTMFQTFPLYTVFFAVTHATMITGFLDCIVEPEFKGELGEHFIVDVPNGTYYLANGQPDNETLQNMRDIKAANLNLPPYNFVQLNCCEIGEDNRYAKGFGIEQNSVDRACLAWKDTILLDDGEANWTQGVWTGLSAGLTLFDAVMLQNVASNPTSAVSAQIGDWPIIPFKWAFPTIYGDKRMTLHGVYTGTNTLTFGGSHANQWYRPI